MPAAGGTPGCRYRPPCSAAAGSVKLSCTLADRPKGVDRNCWVSKPPLLLTVARAQEIASAVPLQPHLGTADPLQVPHHRAEDDRALGAAIEEAALAVDEERRRLLALRHACGTGIVLGVGRGRRGLSEARYGHGQG